MKRSFTLAMLMLASAAHAQQVHKCVDRSGNTSYQSAPCSHAQTTARTWEAAPDPVPENAPAPAPAPAASQRKLARSPHAATSSPRKTGRSTGAAIPVENSGNSRACATAKAKRTRTLERVGLKRSFELLSKLDEAVRSACK